MPVKLSMAATVGARLVQGHRQLASRGWQLRAGSYLLRMRVPARVRPGSYRIKLAVSGGGQTQQITRPCACVGERAGVQDAPGALASLP